ncbi:hypothetical protein [Catenulispora rubra]|uniref:hypothetical protein n=1 Tax=Catenulispora rubra TaxID=280293 RepID=UPI0018927352|nr:hypothetical protein [Catenulispora rubra]
MRPTPAGWAETIAASHRVVARVESWRGGAKLADVPIISGTVTFDDTAALLRRQVVITVPIRDAAGNNWVPESDYSTHPLSCAGQRLKVYAGIEIAGAEHVVDLGWYLISAWRTDYAEGYIEVRAVDLSQLIRDWRHLYTETPWGDLYDTGGAPPTFPAPTLRQAFDKLMTPYFGAPVLLPHYIAPGLPADQRVNPMMVWGRDRWENLRRLSDGITPTSRLLVDDNGTLCVLHPYDPNSPVVATIRTGEGGTLTVRDREASRDRMYNAMVVHGQYTGDAAPQALFFWLPARQDEYPGTPVDFYGPFGPKPRFYYSEYLTAPEHMASAARAMLDRCLRLTRTEVLPAVANPALELGDMVRVEGAGAGWTGRVIGIRLPLTATGGGVMDVTVSDADPAQRRERGDGDRSPADEL